MKIARVLAGSAAAAVMVLVPQAAFAADGYGQPGGGGGNGGGSVGNGGGSAWATPVGSADTAGGLPSTGSGALDTAIAGAGLLLLVGGGAAVVASRRKELEPA